MPGKPMTISGPDHPVTPDPGRVVVRVGGRTVAGSRNAPILL
jgi:uncharacterized protein (DUF427 family)